MSVSVPAISAEWEATRLGEAAPGTGEAVADAGKGFAALLEDLEQTLGDGGRERGLEMQQQGLLGGAMMQWMVPVGGTPMGSARDATSRQGGEGQAEAAIESVGVVEEAGGAARTAMVMQGERPAVAVALWRQVGAQDAVVEPEEAAVPAGPAERPRERPVESQPGQLPEQTPPPVVEGQPLRTEDAISVPAELVDELVGSTGEAGDPASGIAEETAPARQEELPRVEGAGVTAKPLKLVLQAKEQDAPGSPTVVQEPQEASGFVRTTEADAAAGESSSGPVQTAREQAPEPAAIVLRRWTAPEGAVSARPAHFEKGDAPGVLRFEGAGNEPEAPVKAGSRPQQPVALSAEQAPAPRVSGGRSPAGTAANGERPAAPPEVLRPAAASSAEKEPAQLRESPAPSGTSSSPPTPQRQSQQLPAIMSVGGEAPASSGTHGAETTTALKANQATGREAEALIQRPAQIPAPRPISRGASAEESSEVVAAVPRAAATEMGGGWASSPVSGTLPPRDGGGAVSEVLPAEAESLPPVAPSFEPSRPAEARTGGTDGASDTKPRSDAKSVKVGKPGGDPPSGGVAGVFHGMDHEAALQAATEAVSGVQAMRPRNLHRLEEAARRALRTRQEVELVLHPPELGRLRVRVEVSDARVGLVIVAAGLQAGADLAAHRHEIGAALGRQGLGLDYVDVQTSGGGAFGEPQPQQQHGPVWAWRESLPTVAVGPDRGSPFKAAQGRSALDVMA